MRRWMLSCAVPALIISSLFGESGDRQSCRELLDSGDVYYEAFNNYRALELYTRAYRLCPQDFEPLWKKTRAFIDVGEDTGGRASRSYFETAMQWADTMQQRYPDSVASWFLMAAAAGNLARIRSGAPRVRLARVIDRNTARAIQLDPQYAPAYVVRGAFYREVATASSLERTLARIFLGGIPEGTLEDSERVLRTALRLEPDNIYAHLEIALTLIEQQRPREARTHLQRVLDLPITGHQDRELKNQAREILDGL